MSAYKGYRLMIHGNVFPNSYMSKGTWDCSHQRKLVKKYDTADGVNHEEYFDEKKVNISFQVRASDIETHEEIAQLLSKKDDVYIQYWNDDTCSYCSAVCKIDDIKWHHENALDDDIMYSPATVKITEY